MKRRCRKLHKGDQTIAVAYVRSSTASQQNGAAAQRDAISRHAASTGIRVVAWHEDLGVSGGSPPSARAGFSAALADLGQREAGILLVAKRDRLARDVLHAAMATRLAEREGARIVTADGLCSSATPEGALLRTLVDAFSAYEREIIRARTQAALAARRSRGQRYTRFPPFGYSWDADGHAVEQEDEQRTIARMIELRAEGLSYSAVGQALMDEGRPPRRASSWSVTVVRRILLRHVD